ncbi:MAG TPA: serine hydrolase [Luteibacter sp.]|uniref:serine hydrolase domain-containing protein n=1 Tax=Luteibacter sp. TaxID=1886636 RepID=UPI002CA149F7|nr:serine hydrolase [Luteibacter sp.]HVI54647.1 serine hydrolase [Luteibacter sp.]
MGTKTLIAGGIVVVAVASAWVVCRPDRALRVAAGVAAHHVCSMTFVAGQDPTRTYDELVLPMIGNVAGHLLHVHVAQDAQRVEVSSSLRTLASATFTRGYGCRLDLPGNLPLVADPPTLADSSRAFGSTAPEQPVATDKPGMASALDRVFAEHAGEAPKNVKAVVVVKNGQVVAERYAQGFGVRTPLISFSVAKSVTNALLGVLVSDGKLRVERPLDPPEWRQPDDPRASITVEDLMRMRSGLAAEEAESAFSPVAQMEFLHGDMAGYAAAQPAKEAAGKTFEYTSADTLLLDRKVGELVGGGPAGMRAFARRRLFDHLGMHEVTMEFDGKGSFIGSTYVYASARDYARFGLLYLNDGVAPDGQRLLPPGWVSWSRASTLGAPYGAGFWTNDGPSRPARWRVDGGFPKDGFFASGTMGQRIYIVPSAQLVITRFGYSAPPDYGIEDDVALIKAAIESYQ